MKIPKIDAERMRNAFAGTVLELFDFEKLKSHGLYIRDMEDVAELSAMLEYTRDLQDRCIILDMLRVRVGAFLHKHPPLEACLQLSLDVAEDTEADKYLSHYIVKLLHDGVEQSTDPMATMGAYYPLVSPYPQVLHTFMRLLGEKFFTEE